jgi:hypothetical protein
MGLLDLLTFPQLTSFIKEWRRAMTTQAEQIAAIQAVTDTLVAGVADLDVKLDGVREGITTVASTVQALLELVTGMTPSPQLEQIKERLVALSAQVSSVQGEAQDAKGALDAIPKPPAPPVEPPVDPPTEPPVEPPVDEPMGPPPSDLGPGLGRRRNR